MKKVSVILTTFNCENHLQDVLDSIKNQEGVNILFKLELLVVDDCSTDATRNVLKENKIKFYSTNKNSGGPNKGRNLALKKSTGDYLCIADHDDIWMPGKIQKLLSLTHLASIVSSGYFLFEHATSKKIKRVNKSSEGSKYITYSKNQTFLSKLSKSHNGQETYLGSLLFDKSFKNLLFEEKYGMVDFDWVLRLFHNQKSVEFCDALYIRKVKNDNLSLNERYRINDYNYSLNSILEYEHLYPKKVSISKMKINGSMARYYYLMGDMKKSRKYFLKSSLDFKTMLYLITTFVGSKIVKKYFKVFG